MPFCSSCGQPLSEDDRFCTSCGAPRDTGALPAQEAQSPDEIRWTNKVLGMASDFYVNSEGAGQGASMASSAVNTTATVGGALLGSLTAAGAGILAKSREDDFIRWDESRTVALDKKKKTVTVTRKSLVFPIRLYCTDENYEQVAAYIRSHVDKALIKEK